MTPDIYRSLRSFRKSPYIYEQEGLSGDVGMIYEPPGDLWKGGMIYESVAYLEKNGVIYRIYPLL
jgi:hypothetical protein